MQKRTAILIFEICRGDPWIARYIAILHLGDSRLAPTLSF